MAALLFGAAQSAASMVEGERDSVRIQSALMQINADAVCLVRTQFQQVIELLFLKLPSHPMSSILFRCATSLLSAFQGHEQRRFDQHVNTGDRRNRLRGNVFAGAPVHYRSVLR